MSGKILLSTDIGSDVDDSLALLAMKNSGLDLRGIYTVNGNVTARAFIAKKFVDLSGVDIEVGVGESDPIDETKNPYSFYESSYVDKEYIDEESSLRSPRLVYKKVEDFGIKPDGLEALATQLDKGKHIIFSIAPLTNIARLIDKHPKVLANIGQLYIMGCRFENCDAHEHNVFYDISAAQRVFNSNIPITVIPGNLCSRYRPKVDEFEQFTTPQGEYVDQMFRGFLAAHAAIKFGGQNYKKTVQNIRIADVLDINGVDRKKLVQAFDRKERLSENLGNAIYGSQDPLSYFKEYYELISLLEDPEIRFKQGEALADQFKKFVPSRVSVADVYVPFTYQNPGKIQVSQGTVKISDRGISRLDGGNKHQVITNIDKNSFRQYLKSNLR